uniref:Uncharacterized protein n=1 Tax=Glossina austeni TaxID=7395 RepID=A0A1A9UH72_GLOAU
MEFLTFSLPSFELDSEEYLFYILSPFKALHDFLNFNLKVLACFVPFTQQALFLSTPAPPAPPPPIRTGPPKPAFIVAAPGPKFILCVVLGGWSLGSPPPISLFPVFSLLLPAPSSLPVPAPPPPTVLVLLVAFDKAEGSDAGDPPATEFRRRLSLVVRCMAVVLLVVAVELEDVLL